MTRFVALVAGMLALAVQAPPPESSGTPEAKASYDAGIAAVRAGDRQKAATLFRKAIDADPRFVSAHEAFIDARNAEDGASRELTALYRGWAGEHPDIAVYEWALATLAGTDWAAARDHLTRAIAISPTFARAYQDLASIAELGGDNAERLEYLKKAYDLNPADASSFLSYANAMKAVDRAAYIALMQQVADRFPRTDRAAQGLYWAAYDTADVPAKIAIYERLRRELPPETFSWSESGMHDFFELLVGVDPAKARALAADMQGRIASASERKAWQDLGDYAAALADASALRAKGDDAAAARRLDGVTLPRGSMDPAPLALARARALAAAGSSTAAYTSLVAVTAKTPSDALIEELAHVGAALKKTREDVQADLRSRRQSAATLAPAFTLPGYPDRRNVSLADYKGRVVLLNFFYLSCGPCRGEFPALQRVLDKYADRGFAILSINVMAEERDLVVPYFTKNRFGFRPVEATAEWAELAFGVRGFPTNLLVDADGRIVFRPGIVRSPREQRTLELQVESLLRESPRGEAPRNRLGSPAP
jgi:thiol-disulfide isomerase/thioredoxin/Tfp pilus assembly protein PilF